MAGFSSFTESHTIAHIMLNRTWRRPFRLIAGPSRPMAPKGMRKALQGARSMAWARGVVFVIVSGGDSSPCRGRTRAFGCVIPTDCPKCPNLSYKRRRRISVISASVRTRGFVCMLPLRLAATTLAKSPATTPYPARRGSFSSTCHSRKD